MPKINTRRMKVRRKDKTWEGIPGFGDGVYPVVKTDAMTQPVGRDAQGRLFTAPSAGGGTGTGTVTSVAGILPDENGNVPLTAENVGAAKTSDIPVVFDWARADLPFTESEISDTISGAGFVVNPTNFVDGKTYFRYHAGATNFTWTNPNPQKGAVTITVLSWKQWDASSTGNSSTLNIVYADGTSARFYPQNGVVSTYITDSSKTLTQIKGNYDVENWVLLDMSVMSIVADYPAPTGTVKTVNGVEPDETGNVEIPDEVYILGEDETIDDAPEDAKVVYDPKNEGGGVDLTEVNEKIDELSEAIADLEGKIPSGGSGANTGISNDYKWIAKGQMRKPVRDFQGWAHGVQFDSELGVAVCMIISGDGSHSNKAPYYRATIDPATGYMSEYEVVRMYDENGSELSDCGYFSSFNIFSDGTYLMTDLYRRFFTSADKGYTWNYSHTITMENEADNCTIWGITELSNGRWIASNGGHNNNYGGTFYSDDKGLTWTRVATTSVNVSGTNVSFPEGATPFEAVFVEIGGGKVAQYARATNSGINSSGVTRGNREPALFAVSDDYGETWTTFVPSASITDMSCCNGKVVVDGDTVHFLYCSRYLYTTDPTGKQRSGAVFYAKSNLDDVYNDRWETPIVIDYGHWDADTAASVTDIGYPSLWTDSLGNLNGVYYDSAESIGENAAYNANWRYLFGSPVMNQSPVLGTGNGSMTVSYSQDMVDALLSALKSECDENLLAVKTELEKKIAAIVIGGGGELPDDEDNTDGSLYVLNGLIDTWDFSNEDNYDTENLFVKSEYGKFRMKPIGTALAYNPTYGGVETKQILVVADLENNPCSSWLPESAESVTFEEVFRSDATGSYILGIQGDNNTATMFSEVRKVYPANGGIVVDSDATTAWFQKVNVCHVAITFTANEMKLYENGVLTYTLTAESAGITSFDIDYVKTVPFVVNRQNVNTKTARVYSRALSADEIVNNFTYENNLHSIVT